VLRRFAEPVALLDYLCGTRGDLDNKDKVLAVLVRAAQARGALAKLAMSLLLLGLWPALDGIFRRNVHRFPGGPDELASEITACFTANAHDSDLRRINRVAATLVMNTERRVRDHGDRALRRDGRKDELPEVGHLPDMLISPARLPSGLGIPAGLSPEQEVEALRRMLAGAIGKDADLVVAVAIEGATQREAADLFGLTYEAARKRYQRAMHLLPRWMSHFASRYRVYWLERACARSNGAKR